MASVSRRIRKRVIARHMEWAIVRHRVTEKRASRARDQAAILSGEKTLEQVCEENTAIHLSGERIDFENSDSELY